MSEVIKVYKNNTEELTDETYLIHLSPPVMLHNLLDFPVKILIQVSLSTRDFKQ